jgi:hypothetical protein
MFDADPLADQDAARSDFAGRNGSYRPVGARIVGDAF